MKRGKLVAALMAAVVVIGGGGALTAVAATSGGTMSCAAPVKNTTGTAYTSKCSGTISLPAPPTETVTQTVTQTVTASPSSAPTSSSPASSDSSTSAPTSSDPSTPASSSSTTEAPPPSTDMPGPANTGPAAGTTFAPFTGNCRDGACYIFDDNTVLDSVKFPTHCGGTDGTDQTGYCVVEVMAKNATIKNSVIPNGGVYLDTDRMPTDTAWSATIVDSEIDGPTSGEQGAVCCGNVTVLRSNLHGGHNGVQCDMDSAGSFCDIEDSWIHDQLDGGPVGLNHLGGILSDGNQPKSGNKATTTILHNTIACDHIVENGEGCTGDLNFIPHFSVIANLDVERNYFVGNSDSAYCTYGGGTGAGGDAPYIGNDHDIVYKDNVFQKDASQPNGDTTDQCADYGPVTGFDSTRPGNVWSGNHYDDAAQTPVKPEN